MKTNVRVLAALVVGLSILCVHTSGAVAAPAWDQQTVEIAPPPGADPELASTRLHAVSCGGTAACSAVGTYEEPGLSSQVMAVSKVAGIWGSALKLALPAGHERPYLGAISCASAGNCVAVGEIHSGLEKVGFIAEQKEGSWGWTHDVPGPAGADWAWLAGVSCAANGNCTAVGGYEDALGDTRPMAVSESGGVWGGATAVQGPAGPAAFPEASLRQVSCAAANSCSAFGMAFEGAAAGQALVATRSGGTWGIALEIDGPPDSSPFFASGISCGGTGSCAVGGFYEGSDHLQHPAVAEEVGGVWGGATAIPFPTDSPYAGIESVSCPAAGDCAVVGHYEDGAGDDRAFRAESSGGAWSPAVELPTPRTAEESPYHLVGMSFLDCPAVGSCAAVGHSFWRGVGALEEGGHWGDGGWVRLPANAQSEEAGGFESLSCGSHGSCAAVGEYTDSEGMGRAMVLDTDEAFDLGNPGEVPTEVLPPPQPGPPYAPSPGGGQPPATEPPPQTLPATRGGKHHGHGGHCRKGFRKKVDQGKARCVKKKQKRRRS